MLGTNSEHDFFLMLQYPEWPLGAAGGIVSQCLPPTPSPTWPPRVLAAPARVRRHEPAVGEREADRFTAAAQ